MASPVYVLLPEGVEWVPVPATTAQATTPVRWYLRQQMPEAGTQTAVLVSGSEEDQRALLAAVARTAQELGGVALDGRTQEPLSQALPLP